MEQLYRNNYSIYNIMFYIVYYGPIGKRHFGPRRRCVSYMEFAPLAPPLYFGLQQHHAHEEGFRHYEAKVGTEQMALQQGG